MQSTENEDRATPADVTRVDIDALVTELREFGQAVTVGWLSAARYARAAVALAAERDRADRAEARLVSAPHEDGCMLGFHYEDASVGVCDCWKLGL